MLREGVIENKKSGRIKIEKVRVVGGRVEGTLNVTLDAYD